MPRRSERQPPAPPRPARIAAFRRGLAAESRAAALLAAQGLRIVMQRWRSPVGEIDIVARGDRLLVFAEVKARASADAAAWSLTARQRARIIAGAQAWLADHPEDGECYIRFDVVLVAPAGPPTHIPNAFDASP